MYVYLPGSYLCTVFTKICDDEIDTNAFKHLSTFMIKQAPKALRV